MLYSKGLGLRQARTHAGKPAFPNPRGLTRHKHNTGLPGATEGENKTLSEGRKLQSENSARCGRGSQGTRKLQEAAGSTAFQLTSPVFHKHSTQPCFTPWQCLGLLAGVFFPSDTCGLLKQRQRDTEEERSHSGPLFLKAVWTEGR